MRRMPSYRGIHLTWMTALGLLVLVGLLQVPGATAEMRPRPPGERPRSAEKTPKERPARTRPTARAPGEIVSSAAKVPDLVMKIRSSEDLIQLSKQANTTPSKLLITAQEMELKAIIGPQNIAQPHLRLLRMIGIQRPEDFAQFAGDEVRLAGILADYSRMAGIPPPSVQAVRQWMLSAEGKTSIIPPVRTLLGASAGAPPTSRFLSLGGSLDRQLSLLRRTRPGGRTIGYGTGNVMMAAVAGIPSSFSIAPSDKTVFVDFPADKPGLYRIRLSLNRPGGFANLKWGILKPVLNVVPGGGTRAVDVRRPTSERTGTADSISGPKGLATEHVPLITGSEVLDTTAQDYEGYFWLKSADAAPGKKLSFGLIVIENWDVVSNGGGIEAGHVTRNVAPTKPVTGNVLIMPVDIPTVPATLNGTVRLDFWDEQSGRQIPLIMAEIPLQSNPKDKNGQLPWVLDITLSPFPNRYKPKWDYNKGVFHPDWSDGHVVAMDCLYNDDLVPGSFKYEGGVGYFSIQHPRQGVYRMLVRTGSCIGAAGPFSEIPSFSDLCTRGVMRAVKSGPQEKVTEYVDLSVKAPGIIEPPTVYTAILAAVGVSDQEEDDSLFGDGCDDGLGEFTIDTTVCWGQSPNMGSKGQPVFSKATVAATKWFRRSGGWPRPGVRVRIPPDPNPPSPGCTGWTYPNQPLACWSDESLKKYDILNISLSVVEHDCHSLWRDAEAMFGVLKPFADFVVSLFSKDYIGALKNVVEFGKAAVDYRPAFAMDWDDIMGYPAFNTTRNLGFGFPAGESAPCIFEMYSREGPEHVFKEAVPATTAGIASERGWRSSVQPGAPGRRAVGIIYLRKANAYWANTEVRLLKLVAREGGDMALFKTWSHLEPTDVPYSTSYLSFFGINPHQPTTPPDKFANITTADYRLSAGFYIDWCTWLDQPGGNSAGPHISQVFFYDDFVNQATTKAMKLEDFSRSDDGKTLYNYYRDGAAYVGHFIVYEPVSTIEMMEIEVRVRMWQGS